MFNNVHFGVIMSTLPQNIFTITSCKNVGTKHAVVPCWQSDLSLNLSSLDFTVIRCL